VRVVLDRETGRSRGFGFVTFVNAEDAQKAAESLNESELDGRKLNISFARNNPTRSTNFKRPRGEDKEESFN
jgi:nucleolin